MGLIAERTREGLLRIIDVARYGRDVQVIMVHEDDPDRPSAALPDGLQSDVPATKDSPYEQARIARIVAQKVPSSASVRRGRGRPEPGSRAS